MTYEVIVVGGGIGGLTTAALLAARGVDVCLFERNEFVGGCVANFQHSGHTFEPTAGLYSGWEAGGVYENIFSELPIQPPEVRRVSPAYVVRLPDQSQFYAAEDAEEFEQSLANTFPECADHALNFYRGLVKVDQAASLAPEPLAQLLKNSSARFRSFVDAQLQIFGQSSTETVSQSTAAAILLAPMRGLYAMRGGADALANVLMESIKKSGGTIRLNSTVLRLAYAPNGLPIGVDLLSGERVLATRAIVSNLTVWDTYGKLVGLKRTPAEISAQLKGLRGWGAYLMFLAIEKSAMSRLAADRLLAVTALQGQENEDAAAERQFIFAAAPEWDPRGPAGKRSVTICALADVDDWFSYHEDNADHERMDQDTLEKWWARLHAAMPELGDCVEPIETVTPRTSYETTRRKLGMVGSPIRGRTGDLISYQTAFPNFFMVGDTVSSGSGLASISGSAQALAAILTR